MSEDKKRTEEQTVDEQNRDVAKKEEKIWDMKQELEDYLEEQGIYIRQ